MVKSRATDVEGGVEPEEVDEITEQSRPRTKRRGYADSAEEPETLDDFLSEMFQTTTQEENGMPSLEWLKEQFKTKSAAIRYLHNQGFPVKDISKHLGIRYQHVRNVLTTELKRGPNEPFKLDDYRSPKLETEQSQDSND